MAWDPTLPAGGRAFREGDDAIRANNQYIEDTLGVSIDAFSGSGNTGLLKANVIGGVGSRPPSPLAGMFSFRTDINGIEIWTGTQWIVVAMTPVGAIVDYVGNTASVPAGWRGCWTGAGGSAGDVVNGITVPDLGGRFGVGYDPGDTDYDALEAGASIDKGFVVEHDNIEQFASDTGTAHHHQYLFPVAGAGGLQAGANIAITSAVDTTDESAHTHTIGKVGADAIDKRPPYYVLGKIVYVGVA